MILYPYQREDVDGLAENGYVGLLALEPGGGKTFEAATAIKESGAKVTLVIAPKSTHESAWIKDLAKLGLTGRIIGNGNKSQKAAMNDFFWGVSGVYLVTPQLVTRSDVSMWSGDMLVVDEAHQTVTKDSKIQKTLSGRNGLNTRFPMRVALSGTPIRQDVANGWGLARLLWPELDQPGQVADAKFWRWAALRLEEKTVYTNQRDQWGNPKTVKQFTGEKTPGALFAEMPYVRIHKRREKCCEHHPNGFLSVEAPQEIYRTVELTAAQKRNISDMESFMMTYLEENLMAVDIPLTQKQRIRQMTLGEATSRAYMGTNSKGEEVEKYTLEFSDDCKSPFLDEVLHILGNLPEGEPVVVYLESQRFAEVAVKRLNEAGYAAQEYSGKRKADLKKFGEDYQVLVGVISAVGVGTDGIQKVCSTEIWIEQPVSLTALKQAQARADRLGAKAQVQRYILLDSEGVQEGRVEDLILKKRQVDETVRVG